MVAAVGHHKQRKRTHNHSINHGRRIYVFAASCDCNVAEKWKKFRLTWSNYALATELNKTSEPVQVATLLTVIGEDARDGYSIFDWDYEANKNKIEPVLQQFANYF